MSNKKVLIIVPSIVAARGLESVFSDLGEFEVAGILKDLSHSSQARLRNIGADVVLVDPSLFDYESRKNICSRIGELTDASVVAFQSGLVSDEVLKQFEQTVSLYDEPTAIIRKLRAAVESRQDSGRADGEELSAREKEILVCVAKGMLNKEIADKFNISIYTVITHRKNITRKTGIKTVAGLTVYALLNNLIDMNSLE